MFAVTILPSHQCRECPRVLKYVDGCLVGRTVYTHVLLLRLHPPATIIAAFSVRSSNISNAELNRAVHINPIGNLTRACALDEEKAPIWCADSESRPHRLCGIRALRRLRRADADAAADCWSARRRRSIDQHIFLTITSCKSLLFVNLQIYNRFISAEACTGTADKAAVCYCRSMYL